jgi:hypothetical protein
MDINFYAIMDEGQLLTHRHLRVRNIKEQARQLYCQPLPMESPFV